MKSSTKLWERITASATLGLAFATVWLAVETRNLARDWRNTSDKQVGVRTWLTLIARFDSNEMTLARKTLATQLENYNSNNHDNISEGVLDLFEDIGTLYNEGLLDKHLAASSFSYFATRWWEAAQPYIAEERRRHEADPTIFQEFEKFAKAMRQPGEKIDAAELSRFLTDEKNAKIQ